MRRFRITVGLQLQQPKRLLSLVQSGGPLFRWTGHSGPLAPLSEEMLSPSIPDAHARAQCPQGPVIGHECEVLAQEKNGPPILFIVLFSASLTSSQRSLSNPREKQQCLLRQHPTHGCRFRCAPLLMRPLVTGRPLETFTCQRTIH